MKVYKIITIDGQEKLFETNEIEKAIGYLNENNCFVKCSDSSFINSRYIVSFEEVKNIETRDGIKAFK